jgi:pyrroline-5-carboxylate reductase
MNIAILGGGRMGGALVRGMLASGITTGDRITLSSSSAERAGLAAADLGVTAASSNAEALKNADVVFLCVKPAKALAVMEENAPLLAGKLLISVVAGVRSSDLIKAARSGVRLIRAMPNTAVRLRQGITAISPDDSASPDDLKTAKLLFSSVGTAVVVLEEDLDTVTAVSGSGPAFALLMIEALMQGGIEGGLSEEQSRKFASGALEAAAALVAGSAESPLTLREEITSPGGTTAAGLLVLEDSDFTRAVRGAVQAAKSRSVELSHQFRKG